MLWPSNSLLMPTPVSAHATTMWVVLMSAPLGPCVATVSGGPVVGGHQVEVAQFVTIDKASLKALANTLGVPIGRL
jgi:hypothetical protein